MDNQANEQFTSLINEVIGIESSPANMIQKLSSIYQDYISLGHDNPFDRLDAWAYSVALVSRTFSFGISTTIDLVNNGFGEDFKRPRYYEIMHYWQLKANGYTGTYWISRKHYPAIKKIQEKVVNGDLASAIRTWQAINNPFSQNKDNCTKAIGFSLSLAEPLSDYINLLMPCEQSQTKTLIDFPNKQCGLNTNPLAVTFWASLFLLTNDIKIGLSVSEIRTMLEARASYSEGYAVLHNQYLKKTKQSVPEKEGVTEFIYSTIETLLEISGIQISNGMVLLLSPLEILSSSKELSEIYRFINQLRF